MLLLEVTSSTHQKVCKLLLKIICKEIRFCLSYIANEDLHNSY